MNRLVTCKLVILSVLMLALPSSLLAATFHPQTIAASVTDMPILKTPLVKVGDNFYTGYAHSGTVGRYGITIPLPFQEPAYTKRFQLIMGNSSEVSNFIYTNNRLYSVSAGDTAGVSSRRISYISFVSFDNNLNPVTKDYGGTTGIGFDINSTISDSVLTGKFFRPTGALAADAAGNIYVADRGNATGAAGSGVIWKIVPVADSSNHTASAFHDFNGQGIDSGNTSSFLLVDDNYLYGLNSAGGLNNKGTLFRKNLDNSGSLEILHTFNTEGIPDGDLHARSSLLIDGDWLYGTVTDWASSTGHGVVFRIKTDGSDFAVLHHFTGHNAGGSDHDGSKPAGPLAIKDGWIYGTTLTGGESNTGAIYRIDTSSGAYEHVGSFGVAQIKPLGLLYDVDTDAFYGTTQGSGTNGAGTTVFKLVEEKAFEISLASSRADVELGKQNLTLNWSVQAAPADAVCSATSDPVNADWDTPALVLEDDNGKKKGSGTTLDLAGVHSNMQANSEGSSKANNFTLTCTSVSDPGITKTTSVAVAAREPAPLDVNFSVAPNSVFEKVNFFWNVAGFSNAGGECRGTSDPVGYWSGTYAFDVDKHQLDVPTANGRTGKHTYTFTLVCERNEKDLRNPDNNSVTKTASLEFDFGPGSGGTSSSSTSTSSSGNSSAPASSSAASSIASGPQGSGGGGGAMNLWWMLSLCLLTLVRRVK